VSKEKFAALPNVYQAALRSAAALADDSVRAQYDAANPAALKRLVVGGAQLRLFSQEVLEVCFQTTNDLYAQLSLQNARFKAMADSYIAFRSDEYLWWQVAEYSFDNFMIRSSRLTRPPGLISASVETRLWIERRRHMPTVTGKRLEDDAGGLGRPGIRDCRCRRRGARLVGRPASSDGAEVTAARACLSRTTGFGTTATRVLRVTRN